MSNIRYLDDISELSYSTDELPDYCPICKKSVHPEYILVHFKTNNFQELLCHCPNNNCGSLFFAVYLENPFDQGRQYILDSLYPYNRNNKEFPQEVTDISSEFKEIYNQAYHAEKEN